ncbi:unnamed protein product [Mytilus edulis]|uniref:B box-type domain-containing protein n=1 Tax=Mytilus edulis TaxID=6550 RepID=A0A8S3T385_MYTED|nr:unnamed protein product [Mytilus edulis]
MAEFKLDTGQTLEEDIPPTSNNYCGPCETRLMTTAPQYWCNFCEEGLCAECFEHHKAIKASRSHITVDFTKFMKLKPFISTIDTECKIHDLPFELYCPNHEATCCSFCATMDHSTCLGLKSLPNVVASFRKVRRKKRNVNDLKNNFLELKISGSNLQVFMSSKMIDNTLSDVVETLKSVMTEENISELNLRFKLDPNLKYSISQLLDVYIQKDEPSVLLDPSKN